MSGHDERDCVNCRTPERADEAVPRTGDAYRENSLNAELNSAFAERHPVVIAMLRAAEPSLCELEARVREMGELVREEERFRIVAWLRSWASDAQKNPDHEISVYVPPTLSDAADRIARGEYREKETSDA